MKRIVILGAGTGGTILANRLVHELPNDWSVVVIDAADVHLYQPWLTFVPFDEAHGERRFLRPRAATLRPGVTWIHAEVEALDLDKRTVRLLTEGELSYDLLVLATGARVRPELLPGLVGEDFRQDVFDLFTLGGAQALRHRLSRFHEGAFVVAVASGPIKAPSAPLETLFLADEMFRRRGDRHRIELGLITPDDAIVPRALANLLEQRGIAVEPGAVVRELDRGRRQVVCGDGRRFSYDLLGVVPPHSGAAFIGRTEIGDSHAFVRTDRATLAARDLPDVFVLGDAADLPTPKLGSVAHYEAQLLADNLLRRVHGLEVRPTFDGHASSFVETGGGRALLLDRDYAHAPAHGRMGWLPLLEQSRFAHFGKRAFPFVYWNVVLPGRRVPMPTRRPSFAPPML